MTTDNKLIAYEVQNVANEIKRIRAYLSPRMALDFISAMQEELESHLQDAIEVCVADERDRSML